MDSVIDQVKRKQNYIVHPKKFAMWLFLISVTMVFAAFTSAYIVRKAEGKWLMFELPDIFITSTVIILISSLTMHAAVIAAKKDNRQALIATLGTTLILGIAFLYSQLEAWEQLKASNVFFGGEASNPSGSFLYVLSGVHGAHIIGGIVYLVIVLYLTLNFKVHSKKLTSLQMCATYWHFLDGLWIYLFIFLTLNH